MTRRNSQGEALPAVVPDGGSYDDHQIAEKGKTLTHVDTLGSSTDEATGGQASRDPIIDDLIAALEDCSFQLATLAAATGQFRGVYARALDRATAVMAKARG